MFEITFMSRHQSSFVCANSNKVGVNVYKAIREKSGRDFSIFDFVNFDDPQMGATIDLEYNELDSVLRELFADKLEIVVYVSPLESLSAFASICVICKENSDVVILKSQMNYANLLSSWKKDGYRLNWGIHNYKTDIVSRLVFE